MKRPSMHPVVLLVESFDDEEKGKSPDTLNVPMPEDDEGKEGPLEIEVTLDQNENPQNFSLFKKWYALTENYIGQNSLSTGLGQS